MRDINVLLLRHLSGTASAAEEAEVRRWAAADPANGEQLSLLRDAWGAAGALSPRAADPGRYDTPAELQRVLGRVKRRETAPIPLQPRLLTTADEPRRRKWYTSPLVRVAAVLAVIIGSAVLLSTPHDRFFTMPMQSFATAAGERTTLRLGDGTRITLGPESEIRLPISFPDDARDVRLTGTAYFEVARDTLRPFRVHAGSTVTRVLGTRFVVRAYEGDPEVQVGVEEGRVAVRPDAATEEHALLLTDGQLAHVDRRGTARVLHGASLDPVLAWIGGRLVFREHPLQQVARELERWYDVEIRIVSADLAARPLTLSFEDAELRDVLGVIAASLDASYEIDGRSVTIRPLIAVM